MRAIEFSRIGLLVPSVLLTAVGCADFSEAPKSDGPSLYQQAVAPSASILFPSVGDTLVAGETVELIGMVSDPDGEASTLSATWLFGGAPICEDITPDADGRVFCDFTPESGSGDLALRVEDADGQVYETVFKVDVEAGDAPVISLSGPDTQYNYTDHATVFTGRISGDGELFLSFESNQDGVKVFNIEVAEDGTFVASAMLSEGDHVITAVVESETGARTLEGTTVYVGGPNTMPDCAILTPGEGEPARVGEFSSMTGEVGDADEGPSALRVMWSSDVDGYLGEGQLDPATGLASMDTVLSEGTHEIKLVVFDEVGAGCEDTIRHVVGEPGALVVSGPGEVVDQGDEVDFVATFEGADGERVVWAVDGRPLGTSRLDQTGATKFATTDLPAGTSVVTAQFVDMDGWTIIGETSVVVNGRPTAPQLSGGGAVAASVPLRATMTQQSYDPEGADVSYQYTWTINGMVDASFSGPLLPAAATAVGDEVSVRVVGSDGRIDSEAAEISFQVVNTAPTVDFVSISPAAPTSSDAVVCVAEGSDADFDAVTLSYRWMVDGSPVATGEVLPAGMARGGQQVACQASVSDGIDETTGMSGGAIVLRSAPTIENLAFNVSSADTETILGAMFDTADLDGDVVKSEYNWTVNGVAAGSGLMLSGTEWFDAGDTVELTVTPVDDYHRGLPATVSIVIGDTAPEAPVVDIEGDVSREGDDIVCTIDTPAEDVDGDPITYTFAWARNGEAWDGGTSDTYELGDTISGADVVAGDEWTCAVEASAGGASSADSVSREIDRALLEAVVEYTMADLVGAGDTCSGAEAVADGTLVDTESGVAYVKLPIVDLPAKRVYEMDVTVEAAACNAAEGDTGTFSWAVTNASRSNYPAFGQASLAAPTDCTCPDEGEVLEMTTEVDDAISADIHEIILGIDADSFSLIEDVDGTVVTVTYWY